MAQIISLTATTELEAVNAMLSAIGEAPITNVDTATQADVKMAVNILRNTTREVQRVGWRFNTEFGYEVAPVVAPMLWTDSAGESRLLNIFEPPASLARFTITKSPDQQGTKLVDTAIRPSKVYKKNGAAALVFYDREHNRDGFPIEDRDYLYINPVWWINFEDMPEVARFYCVAKAARDFSQQVVGSPELSGFTAENVRIAYKDLKREEGVVDRKNLFNQAEMVAFLGGRRRAPTGIADPRSTAGPLVTAQFYSQWYEDFSAYTSSLYNQATTVAARDAAVAAGALVPVLNWPAVRSTDAYRWSVATLPGILPSDALAYGLVPLTDPIGGKVCVNSNGSADSLLRCKRPGSATTDTPLGRVQRILAKLAICGVDTYPTSSAGAKESVEIGLRFKATYGSGSSGLVVKLKCPHPAINLAGSATTTVELQTVKDNVKTVVATATVPIKYGLFMYAKCEVDTDNVLRAKVWAHGTAEPADWTVTWNVVTTPDADGFSPASSAETTFGLFSGDSAGGWNAVCDVFSAQTT